MVTAFMALPASGRPLSFLSTQRERRLVVGGETCNECLNHRNIPRLLGWHVWTCAERQERGNITGVGVQGMQRREKTVSIEPGVCVYTLGGLRWRVAGEMWSAFLKRGGKVECKTLYGIQSTAVGSGNKCCCGRRITGWTHTQTHCESYRPCNHFDSFFPLWSVCKTLPVPNI